MIVEPVADHGRVMRRCAVLLEINLINILALRYHWLRFFLQHCQIRITSDCSLEEERPNHTGTAYATTDSDSRYIDFFFKVSHVDLSHTNTHCCAYLHDRLPWKSLRATKWFDQRFQQSSRKTVEKSHKIVIAYRDRLHLRHVEDLACMASCRELVTFDEWICRIFPVQSMLAELSFLDSQKMHLVPAVDFLSRHRNWTAGPRCILSTPSCVELVDQCKHRWFGRSSSRKRVTPFFLDILVTSSWKIAKNTFMNSQLSSCHYRSEMHDTKVLNIGKNDKTFKYILVHINIWSEHSFENISRFDYFCRTLYF